MTQKEKEFHALLSASIVIVTIALISLFIMFYTKSEEAVPQQQVYYFEKYNYVSNWDFVTCALIQVESEDNCFAVGKNNDVGILQITPIYVKEVNRILGEEVYTLEHRTDRDKSLEMFDIYQHHYNPNKDITKAIALHNPRAGQWYMDRVMKEYYLLKESQL